MAKETNFDAVQKAIYVIQSAKADFNESQNVTGIDFSKLIAECDKMEKDLTKSYKKAEQTKGNK